MADNKKIELAKKLNELSKRGESGERDNAKAKLEAFMRLNGITDEMLESDEKKERLFYVSDAERQFFMQVLSSVCGKIDVYGVRGEENKKTKTIMATMTDAEYIEVYEKFKFYWHKYNEDLKVFYSAFIQRNELYVKPDPNAEEKESNTSLDELIKVASMMRGLEKHTIIKTLKES